MEEALQLAWNLLEAHMPALECLAGRLREQETVTGEEVAACLAHTEGRELAVRAAASVGASAL